MIAEKSEGNQIVEKSTPDVHRDVSASRQVEIASMCRPLRGLIRPPRFSGGLRPPATFSRPVRGYP